MWFYFLPNITYEQEKIHDANKTLIFIPLSCITSQIIIQYFIDRFFFSMKVLFLAIGLSNFFKET